MSTPVLKNPWIVFLLPFLVYMSIGSLEPTPEKAGGLAAVGLAIPYAHYPWLYAAKIVLTVAALVLVAPGYRAFPWKISRTAILTGLVGGAVWIGLASLDLEHAYLQPWLEKIGLGGVIGAGDRPAFNPFRQWAGHPVGVWTFLVVRFAGLVVVVPIIEEFFLRGFLMRFVTRQDWWNVPFGEASRLALVVGTAFPMLTHPGELVAAAVWFSMITWLMLRTRNIWDCVAAHAVTNLILGIYVVGRGGEAWRLL